MKNTLEVVVLRSPKFKTAPTMQMRRDGDSPMATTSSYETVEGFADSLAISVEEVTHAQAMKLADEDDAQILPQMPFALPTAIPKSDDEPAPASAPAISWGIEAIGAHNASVSAGNDVVVAVLDTGIEQGHPAFQGVDLELRNFTSEGPTDTNGHGTHTAATIFGRDVDGTRIGVARGVKKALIAKVLGKDGGSTEVVLSAIRWALLGGAKIINMSLGLDFVGFQSRLVAKGYHAKQATSIALAGYRANIRVFDALSDLLAIEERTVSGAVVVSAAGNESRRPDYAITVAPPAAGENFVSVAAVNQQMQVADFSNDEVDIAGPGVGIWSAALGGGLMVDSGTSMAAPHVAGAAVLWWEELVKQEQQTSARIIQQRMFSEAKSLTGLTRRDIGVGLVQVPVGGTS